MRTYQKQNQLFSNELIFVLYLWRLILLRPLTTRFRAQGMILVLAFTALLLLIYACNNSLRYIEMNPTFAIITGFMFLFIIDALMRPTAIISEYAYELVLYGYIPVLFFLGVKDIKKLFSLFGWMSLIMFLLYAYDPFVNYAHLENYMTFGFQMAFPAFIGMDISRSYLGKKWFAIPEIACLIELFVFANRSCILSVCLYLLLKEFLLQKRSARQTAKQFLLFAVILFTAVNIESILTALNKKLLSLGYKSYALSQYVYYFSNNKFATMGERTGGRANIWSNAFNMFMDSPFIGKGSGSFIEKYGYYTHNILLDLLVQYGLVISIVIVICIGIATWKLLTAKDFNQRLLGIFLLCLWFPKLFFSIHLFKDLGIWCFLALGLRRTTVIQSVPAALAEKNYA